MHLRVVKPQLCNLWSKDILPVCPLNAIVNIVSFLAKEMTCTRLQVDNYCPFASVIVIAINVQLYKKIILDCGLNIGLI